MPKMKKVSIGDTAALGDILESLASGCAPSCHFSLYAPENQSATTSALFLVAEPIYVDDDLVEHLPAAAEARGLEFAYSDESLQTVILYAQKNASDADTNELVRLLDYYSKHDSFP
jgi:hypothetical protein